MRFVASAYNRIGRIKQSLVGNRRGSEFVQFAILLVFVVLGLVYVFGDLRDALIGAVEEITDQIENIPSGMNPGR